MPPKKQPKHTTRSVTGAQNDKLTVKLKNNLAKNKAPAKQLKSKVVKVVTRKGASKSSGSSEASTTQGSSPLRDEAILPKMLTGHH